MAPLYGMLFLMKSDQHQRYHLLDEGLKHTYSTTPTHPSCLSRTSCLIITNLDMSLVYEIGLWLGLLRLRIRT